MTYNWTEHFIRGNNRAMQTKMTDQPEDFSGTKYFDTKLEAEAYINDAGITRARPYFCDTRSKWAIWMEVPRRLFSADDLMIKD